MLPPGYTMAIVSAVGMVAAMDVPFPVELTALAMVGLVLRWALMRQNRSHDEHDARLTKIEQDLEATRVAKDIERSLKHALKNEVTAVRATIGVLVPQARRCSCGTMDPLMPVLERLAMALPDPPSEAYE